MGEFEAIDLAIRTYFNLGDTPMRAYSRNTLWAKRMRKRKVWGGGRTWPRGLEWLGGDHEAQLFAPVGWVPRSESTRMLGRMGVN